MARCLVTHIYPSCLTMIALVFRAHEDVVYSLCKIAFVCFCALLFLCLVSKLQITASEHHCWALSMARRRFRFMEVVFLVNRQTFPPLWRSFRRDVNLSAGIIHQLLQSNFEAQAWDNNLTFYQNKSACTDDERSVWQLSFRSLQVDFFSFKGEDTKTTLSVCTSRHACSECSVC